MLKYYLSETRKYYIFIALFVVLAFALSFFLLPKEIPQPVIFVKQKLPVVELDIKEMLTPGDIGELEAETEEPVGGTKGFVNLPAVIFNTSGVIKEVAKTAILVYGSGSNFEDRKPRDLIIFFTDATIVMKPGSKDKYYGLTGLEMLNTGMGVLIEGGENIRGKTKFIANYIHIL